MVAHPWLLLEPELRSRILYPCIALSLIAALFMGWMSAPLNPGPGRNGIIELEFCWLTDCAALLAEWPSPEIALPGLYADFVFLVVYGGVISLACVAAMDHLSKPMARLGLPVAWLVIVAAMCDAVENVALIRLVGGASGPEAAVSFIFATVKFLLVGLGLIYSAAGAVMYLRR